MKNHTPESLSQLSNEFRVKIIQMLTEAKSGHPGGSLSCIDVMTALWFHTMRETPAVKEADKDRFILSKGHAVPALYAIFAKKGIVSDGELLTLRKIGSRLQGHPDRVRIPEVEASTGSLGQGLSVALGIALGNQLEKSAARTFCLLGDGEIQEGQVWEAALAAPKFKLNRLCAIIDANNGQIDGPVSEVMPLEPLADKWKSFGWNVHEINGHDFPAILQALSKFDADSGASEGKPTVILTRTVKGKGVSFMEGKIEWHGVAPKVDERDKAVAEIQAAIKGGH